MTPVRREPLADQAAALLLERVQAGEWAVGGKLPGETTLGPELGVGRSTVREAIRQLVGRGVLVTRQGAGVFVAATDAGPTWADLTRTADIIAVIEARIAIEVEASALAAVRATGEQLTAVHTALAHRDAERDGVATHVDADLALHRAIVVASGNPVLSELFDAFAPRNRDAMIAMLERRGDHGGDADQGVHVGIVDAIVARDPGRAAALTRAHLLAVRDAVR